MSEAETSVGEKKEASGSDVGFEMPRPTSLGSHHDITITIANTVASPNKLCHQRHS